MTIGEVAAACFVKGMVLDVTEELNTAERYWLNKRASEYDVGAILSEQDRDIERYREEGKS